MFSLSSYVICRPLKNEHFPNRTHHSSTIVLFSHILVCQHWTVHTSPIVEVVQPSLSIPMSNRSPRPLPYNLDAALKFRPSPPLLPDLSFLETSSSTQTANNCYYFWNILYVPGILLSPLQSSDRPHGKGARILCNLEMGKSRHGAVKHLFRGHEAGKCQNRG